MGSSMSGKGKKKARRRVKNEVVVELSAEDSAAIVALLVAEHMAARKVAGDLWRQAFPFSPDPEGGSPPPAPSTIIKSAGSVERADPGPPIVGISAGVSRRWGGGPWDDEPDRAEWRCAGLPCLLVRNDFGAWCGYAAVPPGHPAYEKEHHAPVLEEVMVHGGLTYAGPCFDHICHAPQEGEPDNVWWFGFDCSHAWDVTPGLHAIHGYSPLAGESYKDIAYAHEQTELLARQLAEIGDKP
jgi:hypothetical protein